MIDCTHTRQSYLNWTLLLLVCFSALELVASVNNIYRSVERCDRTSRYNDNTVWDPKRCSLHCTQLNPYFGREMRKSTIKFSEIKKDKDSATSSECCCCKYDHLWPREIVRAELFKRVSEDVIKMVNKYDCLPLGLTFRLSDRTKNSYEKLCHYLRFERPLTLLQVVDYAEVASYLNMMQPKHPSIRATIKHEQIKMIDKDVFNALFKAIMEESPLFLDSLKDLNEFEGFQLKKARLFKWENKLRSELRPARKSKIIAIALDEYIASYSMMDIAAARMNISQANQMLAIPERLLRDDYDKYNKEHEEAEARMHDRFDCKLLGKTKDQLGDYLSVMSRMLSSLDEKGVYESMKEVNPSLKYLLQSQKIYTLLKRVNCSPVTKRLG